MTRTLRTILLAAATLAALSPVTACVDEDAEVEFAEEVGGDDDGKADRPDLPLTVIAGQVPLERSRHRVGIIKSAAAWDRVFGTEPPAELDFTRHWVVYYTAGVQATGGYQARVARVRLSDTGRTLKVATVLDRPGPTCLVTQALTHPTVVVRIDRPASSPGANRYTRSTNVVECDVDPACADGDTAIEPAYVGGPDGMECAAPISHCLTRDLSACPQVRPLPPSYCGDGTVHAGPPTYVPSTDGKECAMPTAHCVTSDAAACPLLQPLPPTFCPDGTIVSEPRFLELSTGRECLLPRVHCVADAGACAAS